MTSGEAQSGPARNLAFQATESAKPHRGVFQLDHERKMTGDFGQCLPALVMQMVPGDSFTLDTDLVIRFQALVAPPMHQVTATVHYFFVPTRLCWPKVDTSGNDWETFITGGTLGTNAAVAPRWNVSSGKHSEGSLWDFLGLPCWSAANNFATAFPDAVQPLDFPRRAYNLIWNEYFRDETLQAEVVISSNEDILTRSWTKDYFTSALPWAQRGTSPAFPVSGLTSAVWPASVFPTAAVTGVVPVGPGSTPSDNKIGNSSGATATQAANLLGAFNANSVSLSAATTFTINDFRLNTVIQRLLERNARGGIRYIEWLQSVYSTHPRDERLQRPEYVGGVSQPVVFSEVLQTSSASGAPTPGGTMFGHGISVGRNHAGKYTAPEFGYMIGILTVMPVPAYQQGIPAMYGYVSKYDFFLPEFQGLGEQAVRNQELFLTGDGQNNQIFGYQGRFNEYRYERNTVHGLFQSTLSYWHLGRIFSARPALNSAFISLGSAELTSTTLKRIFAAPSQPGLLISIGNRVRAVRPIAEFHEPGLYKI